MIVYMNEEVDFINNIADNDKLQKVIRRYSFIFIQGNLHDLCDWFVFFNEFKISLDTHTEVSIIESAKEINNPVLWGCILIYSQYFKTFFIETKSIIEDIVEAQISKISEKEPMLHNEFWFVLIFHNCPYFPASLQSKIENIVLRIMSGSTGGKPHSIMTKLVCDFLQQKSSSSGKKPEESIFNWKHCKGISEQITYRTYQRTIFKHYRGNKYGLYASVD